MAEIWIGLAESAVSDLEGIREWYQDQGVPEVGERLILELFERIETLAAHPEIGRIVPELGQAFLRELIHPPFRIVYRLDPGRVRIVRVWRGERLLRLPPSAGFPPPQD